MSYQVLARKWRPQIFEEVVGQKAVVQTLQNALRSKRIAQAFLFAGPRGVGKTSVARILAKALNCVEGPGPVPCNHCDSCLEITRSIAPDVFEIDGASNTGVDHVRDLQETIRYLPQKHRFKIFIVDEVHMLSTPAFNAFLKTLEEPPRHVIFIFATTEPHKIIRTVVDRCQRYDFKKIPAEVIAGHVQAIAQAEGITLSQRGLQLISREADGSLRDAQSMVDQLVTYAGTTVEDRDVIECLGIADHDLVAGIVDAVLESRLSDCLELTAAVFDHGTDLRNFYRDLVGDVRNLMIARISKEPVLFSGLEDHEIDDLRRRSAAVSLERLQMMVRLLIESETLVYRATMPKVVVEALLLRLALLPSGTSFQTILKKLGSLQEKMQEKPSAKSTTRVSDEPDSEHLQTEGGVLPGASLLRPESGMTAPDSSQAFPMAGLHGRAAVEERWLAFKEFVRTRKPLLGSLLDHGTVLSLDDEHLQIEFPAKTIFSESLREESKRRELAGLCTEHFGKSLKVAVLESAGNGSEHADNSGLTAAQAREKMRDEARTHPLVREALSLFGGGIAEIKITN